MPGASARSATQQLGEDAPSAKSGAAMRKMRCERCGIEAAARRQHALDVAQDRLRLLDEGESRTVSAPCCRAPLISSGIAELGAQAGERMADRRLGAAQPLGRTGDAALGHQHVEHDQQVEVEAAEIDLVHDG